MRAQRRLLRATVLSIALLAAVAGAPAHAITFGELDGNRHPYVGSLVARWLPDGGLDHFCTGTLIAPRVVVTASHCTAFVAALGIPDDEIWVTFSPQSGPNAAGLIPATYVTNPDFGFSGPGGFSDPHDIAVVLLSQDAPAAPAVLPTRGLLNELPLRSMRFDTVGYGTVRETRTGGPNTLFWDPQRRVASQSFLALTRSWLKLSMNPSTGSGGTCYGDSGGPHFIAGTNRIVSITVTGDAVCRATDVTYRLDTASARAFLDDFVTLP